jgi:starch phosphorylase
LYDPARLLRILKNVKYPVQLIIAGKAHPADNPGQMLIKQWMDFIQSSEGRPNVVFLSDYDMILTENMVQGVDLWINTPRRPWEACGTSGMKVLVNGGLNLSELDGWWAEAYSPDVGWALGDGKEHGDDPAWDAAEANRLYELLENEVIPAFYNRNSEGVPLDWVEKMRASMAFLTSHFSANRAVREYTESYYLPAAKRFQERTDQNGALGSEIVKWKSRMANSWSKLRFEEVSFERTEDFYQASVQVYLDGLDPNEVVVELYVEEAVQGGGLTHKLSVVRPLANEPHSYLYGAEVPANCPESSYTPRIIPSFPGVAVPLEIRDILWQK